MKVLTGIYNDFNSLKTFYLFAGFCLFVLLLTGAFNFVLVSETLIRNYYAQQLGGDRIDAILRIQRKYQFMAYLVLPLMYLFKFTCITLCITIGTIFSNVKINFSKIFKVVIISEAIFILPLLIKLVWFSFFKTNYTLLDLQLSSPLSLLSIFDIAEVKRWFYYPLSTFNIFELLYCACLTYGMSVQLNKNFKKTLPVVLYSYGSGLTVWTIFIMFLSINFN